MSPTQRTLAYLRDLGYEAHVVEQTIRFRGQSIRRDLAGVGDILAWNEDECLLVQCTSASNVAARKVKAETECVDAVLSWIRHPHRGFVVIGWKKYAKAENGKHWRPTLWAARDDGKGIVFV